LKNVALISDIQGNFTALQETLRQIDNEDVDRIICLGDVASGAHPHEVVSLLQKRDIAVIKGNMDDAILNPQRHDSDDLDVARYDDIDQWCSEQLTSEQKAFMRGFVPLLREKLDDTLNLLCFHGSPYSYNDVIDETLSEETLWQRINGYEEAVMVTGHIHHPFLRLYQQSMILCPGSVGLPRRRDGKHPCVAEYALLTIDKGRVHVAFRQVEVPADEFKKGILKSGMPHAEWFLSLWDVT